MITTYLLHLFFMIALVCIIMYVINGKAYLKHSFNIFMALGFLTCIITLIFKAGIGKSNIATTYDLLTLIIAAFALAYLLLYLKYRRPTIGLFIAPIIVILSIITLFFEPGSDAEMINAEIFFMYVHLPFVIMGSVFLAITFFASILYIVRDYNLKKKNFSPIINRFPPLDTINKILNSSLQIGVSLLIIGIFLGFLYMHKAFVGEADVNFENITTKVNFSLITCLYFLVLLIVQKKVGMLPNKLAKWTILGFILLIITYISVGLFIWR